MNYRYPLLGLIFATFSITTQAATYNLHCPKTINTEQHLAETISGWQSTNANIPHFLSGVSFYVGHPKEQVSLKPELINKKQAKWEFSSQEKLYIVCHYQKTILELTQPLPEKITYCLVTYNQQAQGDMGFLPEHIVCGNKE